MSCTPDRKIHLRHDRFEHHGGCQRGAGIDYPAWAPPEIRADYLTDDPSKVTCAHCRDTDAFARARVHGGVTAQVLNEIENLSMDKNEVGVVLKAANLTAGKVSLRVTVDGVQFLDDPGTLDRAAVTLLIEGLTRSLSLLKDC